MLQFFQKSILAISTIFIMGGFFIPVASASYPIEWNYDIRNFVSSSYYFDEINNQIWITNFVLDITALEATIPEILNDPEFGWQGDFIKVFSKNCNGDSDEIWWETGAIGGDQLNNNETSWNVSVYNPETNEISGCEVNAVFWNYGVLTDYAIDCTTFDECKTLSNNEYVIVYTYIPSEFDSIGEIFVNTIGGVVKNALPYILGGAGFLVAFGILYSYFRRLIGTGTSSVNVAKERANWSAISGKRKSYKPYKKPKDSIF